jgi:O-antigen/teichoic acid export membrane protein
VEVIPPVLRLTRPQLVLLASWLGVSAALAAVGVVTWLQPNRLLAGAFWAAAGVVVVAVVVLGVWYRTRPGSTRRW